MEPQPIKRGKPGLPIIRPAAEAFCDGKLDEKLIEWRAAGWSFNRIAQHFYAHGVSVTAQTISDWCKPLVNEIVAAKNELERTPPTPEPEPEPAVERPRPGWGHPSDHVA